MARGLARTMAQRVARMMTSEHNDDIIECGKEAGKNVGTEGGKNDNIIASS